MVIAPFASFVLALSSVRTRRSASAMAMFGTVVTLLLTLLVAYGIAKRSTPFLATYKYFAMSVAFNGPQNFQTFLIDLVMQVDRVTVVAILALEVCFIAVIGWHRWMGRSETGAARFHAVLSLLLFASIGILVSTDLTELLAFWLLAGALTYILLTHRWGVDVAAYRARIALALPFLTDLCFLFGLGWFYARYGTVHLVNLLSILHTNPGWTVRSIVLGSALLFVGVAGRLALWPFTSWLTRTAVTAPPAASALTQAAWSITGIVVLYRLTPIFLGSNSRTVQAMVIGCAVAAIAAAVLSLFGNEPRRVITLAGSAATAVGAAVVLNGIYESKVAYVAGVAAVLAMAPARAAAVLAISAIAGAMRTDDLTEMGEAWRRIRASSLALLLSAFVLGLAAAVALGLGFSTRSRIGWALGDALFLLAIGAVRLFAGASFGPLRRRRGFDPERMREPQGATGFPYWLIFAAAVFGAAPLVVRYLDFLDASKHPNPNVEGLLLWGAVAVIAVAVGAVTYWRSKDGVLLLSGFAGDRLARLGAGSYALLDRFLVLPTGELARRLGGWVPETEGVLGRIAAATGQLAVASGRAPAIPIVVAIAIVLAVVFAIAAPGLVR